MHNVKARLFSPPLFSMAHPPGGARALSIATERVSCRTGVANARLVAILGLTLSIVAALFVLLSGIRFFESDPLVEMRPLGFAWDKRVNEYSFCMKLSNNGEEPVWIVLPWMGDQPLPKQTSFTTVRVSETPLLDARLFYAEGGMAAVGVSFGVTFRAFRLPPHTVLEIPKYRIWSRPRFANKIDVMEAQELLVNGKIPLEKWLPFRVGVCKQDELGPGRHGPRIWAGGDGSILEPGAKLPTNAEAQSNHAAIPPHKVEYIRAQGARRCTVKIQPTGEKDGDSYPFHDGVSDEARRGR